MEKTVILSIGADGRFAGMVVPELVKCGAYVRGLVHKSENAEKVRAMGAQEVVVGDLRDQRSLQTALEGVERIFYLAPAFLKDEAELGTGIVEASKRAGVRRIVFSSVIHPVLSELQNHVDKAPVEDAVLNSDLEYTFLHPTMFYQNYAAAWPVVQKTGVLTEPYSADRRLSRVDYRDVAETAAIALTSDQLLYGTFELCAEGHLNRRDVASLMGEVLGRKVEASTLPFEEWAQKAGFRQSKDQMIGLKAMYDWYDAHSLLGNALTLRSILGREPRTLREYFSELAANAAERNVMNQM